MTAEQRKEGIDKALEEAEEAFESGEIPVGCALLSPDGQIFCSAHNLCEKDGDVFEHAEIIALKQAIKKEPSKHLKGWTLIVTLEPCLMCLGAILSASVSDVVYLVQSPDCGGFTKYDPFLGKELNPHYIEDKRAQDLLSRFFLGLRIKKA